MITQLYHNLAARVALAAQFKTASQAGDAIDLANANGCVLHGNIGAIGFATDTAGAANLQLLVQHGSATNAFSSCPNSLVVGYVTGGVSEGCFARVSNSAGQGAVKAAYIGTERYVRVIESCVSTHSGSTPVAVMAVLGGMRRVSAT